MNVSKKKLKFVKNRDLARMEQGTYRSIMQLVSRFIKC